MVTFLAGRVPVSNDSFQMAIHCVIPNEYAQHSFQDRFIFVERKDSMEVAILKDSTSCTMERTIVLWDALQAYARHQDYTAFGAASRVFLENPLATESKSPLSELWLPVMKGERHYGIRAD
jgi:hypothetical protein